MMQNIKKIISNVSSWLSISIILALFVAVGVSAGSEEKMAGGNEYSLRQLSVENDFAIAEGPVFEFQVSKDGNLLDKLSEYLASIFSDNYSDAQYGAKLFDPENKEVTDMDIVLERGKDGRFKISIPEGRRAGKPGKYTLKIEMSDPNNGAKAVQLSQDFRWGVLAVNFNKAIFMKGDTAFLQFGVVDDSGNTVCDAKMDIEITAPSGKKEVLTTTDNSIIRNSQCGPNNFMKRPDYYGFYLPERAGKYFVKVTAITANGTREITDNFEVRENIDFDIERIGPTRINPSYDYTMTTKIEFNQDFKGKIDELIPAGFKIRKYDVKSSDSIGNWKLEIGNWEGVQRLEWKNFEIKKGGVIEMEYSFDAPDRSPEFYLLGPLKVGEFEEGRKWQIASDAAKKRVKTVKFLAGTYSGDGTTAQQSDTYYSLPSFSFSLAEKGVEIKNAYINFETQFEAFADNAGNYTGYELAFDSCEGSCTPSAFSGTSTSARTDATVLAYNESANSNHARLLLDVSSEGQLGGYAGEGQVMQGQVGYNIKYGSARNSIASARAVLVVTYTYETDSENLTNTVSYPLESNSSGDQGTRRAFVLNNCRVNATCATSSYNMYLPEYATTTGSQKIAQWFEMQGANDLNTTNDLRTSVNIQGTDATSSWYVLEAASANQDQGNFPAMFFDSVGGYAENTAQTLEFYATSTTANTRTYILGGEVIETYTSSSSAPVKTRTIRFPIGAIRNTGTAFLSGSADIYFPENGSGGGKVNVEKAWFRVIGNYYNTGATTLDLATQVGSLAKSATSTYNYDPGGIVTKVSYNVMHVIPSSNYNELELANALSAKTVYLHTDSSVSTGVSAELVITYTYTDEGAGYLTSIEQYAGQQETNGNDTSELLATANSVFPENANKTIRGAALLVSYLFQDSDGSVANGAITADANLSTGVPVCTNAYNTRTDSNNGFSEYFDNVANAINTTDNQTYTACYSNAHASDGTGGAKMNGQLIYTYQWDNARPTGTINSIIQKNDGSGNVTISAEVDDLDDQDCRIKVEYVSGTACNFASPLDPAIDITDSLTYADYGDPKVDNSFSFQIGTTTGWVVIASGTNTVLFDWASKTNIPNIEGTYCVRITANDKGYDQLIPATTTIAIDNLRPTAPGALTYTGVPVNITATSVSLKLGSSSADTNFSDYRILFREYDGTYPVPGDSVHSSTTDINLATRTFTGTTTISGLQPNTRYSFEIYAYDTYGNNASSTSRVDITTNSAPTSTIVSAVQKADGTGAVDIYFKASDLNGENSRAKVEYEEGSTCAFTSAYLATIDSADANATSSAGDPKVDNSSAYQVGTSTGWIQTGSGENLISIDWLSKADIASASGTYCLRVIVNDGVNDQQIFATATVIIDNKAPVISAVYIANGIFNIGSDIGITISADSNGYSLGSSTLVNGKPLTGFIDNGDNTYSAVYQVAEGDMDRATNTIPIHIVLADWRQNGNAPYISPEYHDASVDANKPIITAIAICRTWFIK